MAIQTSFSKKVARTKDSHDRFFALLGYDDQLDIALLDVKDCVCNISLRENNLIFQILQYRFSIAHLGEKFFWIKWRFGLLVHNTSPAAR